MHGLPVARRIRLAPIHAQPTHHLMSSPRILVIDDDPNLSALVRLFLLKTRRFDVREENRSSVALAVAQQYRPQLILLDVDMPGKDGGDVSRELAGDPLLRR